MAETPNTALKASKPWVYRSKTFGSRQVTALDVDGRTLCVAQAVHRGGTTSVTRLATAELEAPVDFGRSDPAVMGESIAAALRRLQFKPGAVVMGVPRALVVLRTLTLPAAGDIREMASMVHFQIAKDLPFKLEEAIIDFKVQGSPPLQPAAEVAASKSDAALPAKPAANGPPPAAKVEVLAAAVKRDVVERYKQTFAAAGLSLVSLGLRSYANARCVEACAIAPPEEAVALVSLRPDEVIIDVVLGRSLLFSRVASVKAHADEAPSGEAVPAEDEALAKPPDRDAFVNAVVIEVVRTLHSYSGMERQSRVMKVAIAGDTGDEIAVVAALGKRLATPCVILNPAHAIGLKVAAGEKVSGATAAMGLGLGVNDPDGLPFDFLNPKRPAVRRDLRRVKIFAGIALAMLAVISALAVQSRLKAQREAVRDEILGRIAQERQHRNTFRLMQLRARDVQVWIQDRRGWLDHYALLSAAFPDSTDIYATAITTLPGGGIRLNVQARNGDVLARLDRDLRAAGYQVKPLAVTPGSDRHGYPFRSTVELRAPARMVIDLDALSPPARPADDVSLDASARAPARSGAAPARSQPAATPPARGQRATPPASRSQPAATPPARSQPAASPPARGQAPRRGSP